jgi:hypothetical protein
MRLPYKQSQFPAVEVPHHSSIPPFQGSNWVPVVQTNPICGSRAGQMGRCMVRTLRTQGRARQTKPIDCRGATGRNTRVFHIPVSACRAKQSQFALPDTWWAGITHTTAPFGVPRSGSQTHNSAFEGPLRGLDWSFPSEGGTPNEINPVECPFGGASFSDRPSR